jgi:leukotriene-A4 hydrolase
VLVSMMGSVRITHALIAFCLLAGCNRNPMSKSESAGTYGDREDHHSYSNPRECRITHVDLDLDASFESRTLTGNATLTVAQSPAARRLILDTRDLKVSRVSASSDGTKFSDVKFDIGASDKILGAPLTIDLSANTTHVRIAYASSPSATGLQWLSPAQTAGKKYPFLYSQSQAIHARSWMPVQDSPGVRVTYTAKIRTPKNLRAVMSARNDPNTAIDGDYQFDMPQAVPPYLIALAVGDLGYQATSSRTGVYAEPPILERAAREFEDMEKMMQAAEHLYGLYRWEQYDVLILPPSFPFGGMENPRLTFATPTLLAGDKSLVGVIAHELAHSWSGNLVTNATWRDFWLNEGFTTYFERRIQEEVYGGARSEMEALLERQELEREMESLEPRDEILYIDLKGRDPDDGMTQVPYVKGMLFLRLLEETFGRERFDTFLRGYFNQFAFRSITTADFVDYLRKNLLDSSPDLARKIDLQKWLSEPGLPESAPRPRSEAFEIVSQKASQWLAGKLSTAEVPVKNWTTQETLHFLRAIGKTEPRRMADLDRTFHFTQSGNSEILFEWLMMTIRNGYQPAYPRLEQFLNEVGRRKYIRPLYMELAKTPAGKDRARAIYKSARPGYHPIAVASIDPILQ